MKNISLLLIAFVVALASCSKDSTNNTDIGGGINNPGGGGTLAALITIDDNGYSPVSLTVKKGTNVTFKNEGSEMHTATADNSIFNTGDIAPGASKTVNITAAGTYTYHCNYHTTVTGTLIITN